MPKGISLHIVSYYIFSKENRIFVYFLCMHILCTEILLRKSKLCAHLCKTRSSWSVNAKYWWYLRIQDRRLNVARVSKGERLGSTNQLKIAVERVTSQFLLSLSLSFSLSLSLSLSLSPFISWPSSFSLALSYF